MAGLLETLLGGGGGYAPTDFATLDAEAQPAIDPLTGLPMPAAALKPPAKPKPYGGSAVPFASTLGLLSGTSRGYDPANDLPPSTNDPASSEPVVFSGGVPLPRPRPVTPNAPAAVPGQSSDDEVSSAGVAPDAAPMSIAPGAAATRAAVPDPLERKPNFLGGSNVFGDGMLGKLFKPENAPLFLALGGGLSGASSLGTGMRRAATGAVPAAMQLQQNQTKLTSQKALYDSLIAKGVPPAEAIAAATNPDMLKIIGAKYFETKPLQHVMAKGPLNEDIPLIFDQTKGVYLDAQGKPLNSGGDASGSTLGASGVYAPGVKKIDPNLSGDEMLAQYHPDVRAAVKGYMNGDVMPTGNPRQKTIWDLAKKIAVRYGQDTGTPVSDALYNQKRQLQTDIVKASPNTVGGIIKNGNSAFAHLGELAENFVKLGNYSGPSIPGGGHIGTVGNVVGNEILPSPETLGKLEAVRDNALKYGQEATKFYAGTGGGAEERMHTLKTVGGGRANAAEQAAFLETEKKLMQDRLIAQHNTVRSTLGQEYLDRHPEIFNPKEYQEAIAKIDKSIAQLRGEKPVGKSAPAGGTAGPRKTEWSIVQ